MIESHFVDTRDKSAVFHYGKGEKVAIPWSQISRLYTDGPDLVIVTKELIESKCHCSGHVYKTIILKCKSAELATSMFDMLECALC